jgi:membrane-bound lytic murein transglycosylase D
MVLAMQRAGSHYERGLQAMRSGNADQAEWEFDAALEVLQDTSVNGPVPTGLLGASRPLASPNYTWLAGSAAGEPRGATNGMAPPDPDEPTLDAPALLDPEDLRALPSAADSRSLPDPDVKRYEFPIVFNDQVRTFVHYFQNRKWGVISRAFERASRYQSMMRQVFREKGLPEELINLAFIESAVNPWATSRAKAAGIWQFIPSTGKLYGMHVSWWLDERRDPEKSTRGAAQYLANLYRMFESWPLALAAYNAGEGAVQRAIDRQKTKDFWKLRLPKETQLFVPAFMAMTIISKEPERYGFSPPPPEPFEAETVTLDQPADFRVLARAARTSVERLRELNPALIRWATPPDMPRYAVRIPAGLTADLLEELAQIPPAQRVSWIAHRVKKGETATAIAKRYGVSLKAIADMNGLSKRQAPKVGATLFVPAPSPAAVPALEKAEERKQGEAKAASGKAAGRHVVKKGETLSTIAKVHGVSVEDLRRWNRLVKTAGVKPGESLRVTAPGESAAAVPARTATAAPKKSVAAPPKRYTVQRGDTLSAIAKAHKISVDDLQRWNSLSKDAPLKPGMNLAVSKPS